MLTSRMQHKDAVVVSPFIDAKLVQCETQPDAPASLAIDAAHEHVHTTPFTLYAPLDLRKPLFLQ